MVRNKAATFASLVRDAELCRRSSITAARLECPKWPSAVGEWERSVSALRLPPSSVTSAHQNLYWSLQNGEG